MRSPRFNGAGGLTSYPGSPALVRAFLRPQDRLIACELEPNAAAALARHLAGDRRSKALAIDGWTALNAYVPPKERRGLVLIDPPFEDAGDFARLGAGARSRAPQMGERHLSAVVPDQGARRAGRAGAPAAAQRHRQDPARRAQLAAPRADDRLGACGLIVVNPPWTLAGELAILLPALAAILSGAGGGAHRVDWVASEK